MKKLNFKKAIFETKIQHINTKFSISTTIKLTTNVKESKSNINQSINNNDIKLHAYQLTNSLVMASQQQKQHKIKTLLIDNYDSYTYNLYQLLSEINGETPIVIFNDKVTIKNIYEAYENNKIDNIVISPGPGNPNEKNDIGICDELFKNFPNIPILGVCLGHQVLGVVHGAMIKQTEPVHGKLTPIRHSGHELFEDIASGTEFEAVRYHSLAIDEKTLPSSLKAIAWTNGISHGLKSQMNNKTKLNLKEEEVIMAICHESNPHYGVQFHPESVGTLYGWQLIENFKDISLKYRYGIENGRQNKIIREMEGIRENSLGWKIRVPPIMKQEERIRRDSEDTVTYAKSISTSSSIGNMVDLVIHEDVNTYNKNIKNEEEKIEMNEIMNIENDEIVAEGVFGGWETQIGVIWDKCEGVLSDKMEELDIIFDGLFKKKKYEDTFWLDSSTKDRGRFSYMGGSGGALWQQISYELSESTNCNSREFIGRVTLRDGSGITNWWYGNFWNYLDDQVQRNKIKVSKKLQNDLPFDFWGGFIGYLGYELKTLCQGKNNQHKSKYPDASFFFADRLVAIDHEKKDIYCLALYDMSVSSDSQQTWVNSTVTFIKNHLLKYRNACMEKNKVQNSNMKLKSKFELKSYPIVDDEIAPRPIPINNNKKQNEQLPSTTNTKTTFKLDRERYQYIKDINKCQEALCKGESYEICLTNSFHKTVFDINARKLYRIIRKTNPAPYSAWMSIGREGDDLTICCSSPERFLKGDIMGNLEASPIKGTAPRHPDLVQDKELAMQLSLSEKNQAENLMIVDLLRNDLGRVCQIGSIKVSELIELHSFTNVHQLISTIKGKLKIELNAVDALKACFPPGSMTGAPKTRTIDILDELENKSRGVYSGCLGYISVNGSFDFNVVIRTAVISKNEISIGAGGAIVIQSEAEDEYNEMILKAEPLVNAVKIYENLKK